MGGNIDIDWIAIDWGTSNLRVWALDSDDKVLATASSSQGMGSLERNGFEPALLALVGDWLVADRITPAIACGMVGARQGWIEAQYAQVPSPPVGTQLTEAPVKDPRLSVTIIPGLCQNDPADVMRGEETQIAGLLAQNPDFAGTLCLPGTHTKWVDVAEGEVTRFTTVMSGEIFALLSRNSVLRHALAEHGWSESAFRNGLDRTLGTPQAITADLFSLRARSLLAGLDPVAARSELSGMLLGIELAGTRPYWQDALVGVIGTSALAANYASALEHCGVQPTLLSGDDLTLLGLTRTYRTIRSAIQ